VTRTLLTLPVTTRYKATGPAWSLGYHTGEDHAGPTGSLINSVTWGEVLETTWGDAYGIHLVIRTASGSYDVAYCHLDDVLVSVGDKVRPGQTIGHLGATGHATGPHLEARPAGGRFGSDVNPLLVKRWGVRL
jgi:murein DD-endopeptidase MepM/ murein hydrolase activator NlpD